MSPLSQAAVWVFILVLNAAFESAAAQRHPGTIRRVSIPSNDEEVLPPFVAKPFDRRTYFSWSIVTLHDFPTGTNRSGDFLAGTFNFTEDLYVAVGIRSPEKMQGPIVLCKARGGSNSSEAGFCVDYFGPRRPHYSLRLLFDGDDEVAAPHDPSREGEDQSARAAAAPLFRTFLLESHAEGDGRYSLTFLKLVRPSGGNTSLIEWGARHRVIFATGKWYDGDPEPKQHQADDVAALLVNFNTGTVERLTSKMHRTVIYVAIGCLVFVVLAAKVTRMMMLRISHLQRRIITVVLCAGFIALVVAYMIANYYDYKLTVTRKAAQRALGDGAAWCLSCLLFPVGRRILFSDLLTVSHERAIKFHAGCALLTVALTCSHGIAMLVVYDSAFVVRWRDKDEVSRLPGIIAFSIMLPLVGIALLRNWVLHFKIFRLSHYMYIPLLFFACCHYPRLAIGVTPGGTLLLLSFLYSRFASPVHESETIENMIFDDDAQVVVLDISKPDFVLPGQFYLLGIPEISVVELHPFSVARATVRDGVRVLRFIIKNTASRAVPAGSGGDSSHAKYGGPRSNGDSAVVTWTSKLFAMVKERRMPPSYLLEGPHGVLQVNPVAYENICLISGGTGIASHNAMLQALALGLGPAIGNIDEKRNIMLVWVIPTRALFFLLYRDLETFGQRLKEMPNKQVVIRIFVTHRATGGAPSYAGSKLNAVERPLPDSLGALEVVEGHRPSFAVELAEFQRMCLTNAFTDGNYSSARTAALYLSGPQALMDDAAQCAENLQGIAVHVHKEQQSI